MTTTQVPNPNFEAYLKQYITAQLSQNLKPCLTQSGNSASYIATPSSISNASNASNVAIATHSHIGGKTYVPVQQLSDPNYGEIFTTASSATTQVGGVVCLRALADTGSLVSSHKSSAALLAPMIMSQSSGVYSYLPFSWLFFTHMTASHTGTLAGTASSNGQKNLETTFGLTNKTSLIGNNNSNVKVFFKILASASGTYGLITSWYTLNGETVALTPTQTNAPTSYTGSTIIQALVDPLSFCLQLSRDNTTNNPVITLHITDSTATTSLFCSQMITLDLTDTALLAVATALASAPVIPFVETNNSTNYLLMG